VPAENDAHPARRPCRGFARRARQPSRGIESNSNDSNSNDSNSNDSNSNDSNSNSNSNSSDGLGVSNVVVAKARCSGAGVIRWWWIFGWLDFQER
jgi:hypothetical protein